MLLSYLMLLSPGLFESLAEGAINYSQLSTLTWGEDDTTIEYQYDDNGSLVSKTATVTSSGSIVEAVVYEYNYQNRLEKITTTPYDGEGDPLTDQQSIVEYKYNPDGIRTEKIDYTSTPPKLTEYLIDSFNHTGYAQVFVEDDGTDVTS